MHCHALSASCFIDSWGNVFPCTIYNKKIGSLRDVDYDLNTLWHSEQAKQLQQEIWHDQCPQCWTPCEAYQSILGNALRPETYLGRRQPKAQPELIEIKSAAKVQTI
jgi:radical SAM protein with 4Fe4S-binding SPASM domain